MSIIHLVNFMILDLVWRVVMFIMGYAQTSLCFVQASRIELGDDYSKFSFREVYRRIYGWKFSFTAMRERSHKT